MGEVAGAIRGLKQAIAEERIADAERAKIQYLRNIASGGRTVEGRSAECVEGRGAECEKTGECRSERLQLLYRDGFRIADRDNPVHVLLHDGDTIHRVALAGKGSTHHGSNRAATPCRPPC